jgi:hypothetical protein
MQLSAVIFGYSFQYILKTSDVKLKVILLLYCQRRMWKIEPYHLAVIRDNRTVFLLEDLCVVLQILTFGKFFIHNIYSDHLVQ